MAFLDFIKNRQQQSVEQPTQPKQETAREMYAREAQQDTAGQRSVAQLPDVDKAQARELGERLDKATQSIRQDTGAGPAPADTTGSPEPMRQNMMSQDKSAPDLSPTSAQRGSVTHEQEASVPSQEESQSPVRESQRPQTIARPAPSWER